MCESWGEWEGVFLGLVDFSRGVCGVQLGLLCSPHSPPPQASALWDLGSVAPSLAGAVLMPLISSHEWVWGCWLSGQGSCGWVGVGTESPPPGPGSPLCSPLGCLAARSLAPAHIPTVMLWVSRVDLVSVRGTEFSQD